MVITSAWPSTPGRTGAPRATVGTLGMATTRQTMLGEIGWGISCQVPSMLVCITQFGLDSTCPFAPASLLTLRMFGQTCSGDIVSEAPGLFCLILARDGHGRFSFAATCVVSDGMFNKGG